MAEKGWFHPLSVASVASWPLFLHVTRKQKLPKSSHLHKGQACSLCTASASLALMCTSLMCCAFSKQLHYPWADSKPSQRSFRHPTYRRCAVNPATTCRLHSSAPKGSLDFTALLLTASFLPRALEFGGQDFCPVQLMS